MTTDLRVWALWIRTYGARGAIRYARTVGWEDARIIRANRAAMRAARILAARMH